MDRSFYWTDSTGSCGICGADFAENYQYVTKSCPKNTENNRNGLEAVEIFKEKGYNEEAEEAEEAEERKEGEEREEGEKREEGEEGKEREERENDMNRGDWSGKEQTKEKT